MGSWGSRPWSLEAETRGSWPLLARRVLHTCTRQLPGAGTWDRTWHSHGSEMVPDNDTISGLGIKSIYHQCNHQCYIRHHCVVQRWPYRVYLDQTKPQLISGFPKIIILRNINFFNSIHCLWLLWYWNPSISSWMSVYLSVCYVPSPIFCISVTGNRQTETRTNG